MRAYLRDQLLDFSVCNEPQTGTDRRRGKDTAGEARPDDNEILVADVLHDASRKARPCRCSSCRPPRSHRRQGPEFRSNRLKNQGEIGTLGDRRSGVLTY